MTKLKTRFNSIYKISIYNNVTNQLKLNVTKFTPNTPLKHYSTYRIQSTSLTHTLHTQPSQTLYLAVLSLISVHIFTFTRAIRHDKDPIQKTYSKLNSKQQLMLFLKEHG